MSGHSSNYVWAKGGYNYVFKELNNLENGDIVKFKIVQKNGRIINFKYKVSEKFITTPDDAKIFEETTKPILTLSTCWPLGTNFKRLIVKAELIK
jgi:LPXTG-site transpeptidase (sortase) family protein